MHVVGTIEPSEASLICNGKPVSAYNNQYNAALIQRRMDLRTPIPCMQGVFIQEHPLVTKDLRKLFTQQERPRFGVFLSVANEDSRHFIEIDC
jgi:hypothetical protein